MPIKTEDFNTDLYDLLKVRDYDPVPINSKGETVAVPQEADVFRFTFKQGSKEFGDVWVTIDKGKNLVLYYNDKVEDVDGDSPDSDVDDSFTNLKKHLKYWARRRQLGFDLKNRDHLRGDMAQRTHMKQKEHLGEGYYPMGKKASYNDSVPTVKILLQHTRQIEEGEQRFRNIAKIFVENTNGERFLVPTIRPGIARVFARHIAEGGTPYDDKGRHITSLVEEYTKMAGFVRATKNGQFNEDAQKLVNEGINHYHGLRDTLQGMTSHRGYNKYFDNWTPVLNEETEDSVSLNELFVQETLDPRIESVLPILQKLNKNITENSLVNELDNWAEEVISEKLEVEGIKPNANIMNKIKKKFNRLEEDDLSEEKNVYFVVKKGSNHAIGTWDGVVFKPFDKTKYPSGQMDMIPKDCEVDKLDGPVGSKEIAMAKIGLEEAPGAETLAHNQDTEEKNLKAFDLEEAEQTCYHLVVDGVSKAKFKDAARANSEAKEMRKSFPDKEIKVEVKKEMFEDDVEEGLDANQKRVGQLGPTEPVGKNEKNLRGKLVGASESVELDTLKTLSGIK
jgi:hypothetical protein